MRLKKAEEHNQLFIDYLENFSIKKTLLDNVQSLFELVTKWIPTKGIVFLQEKPSSKGSLEPVLQLGNITREKWDERLRADPAKTTVKDSLLVILEKNGEKMGSLFAEFEKEMDQQLLRKLEKMLANQTLFFLETDYYFRIFKQELKEETLRLLGEFQKGCFPKIENSLAGFQISAKSLPCSRFSGDFYDSMRIDDNCQAFVLSDVATKGLASFFISAMCRIAIRSLTQHWRSPLDILCRLNELLYPEICGRTIISLIYMVVDEKRSTVTFARAGHELPIFCHNGKIEKIEFPGICLGIDEGRLFNKMVKEYELKLEKGDFLLLFTDGLIEAVNNEGVFFGRQRVENIVQELSGKDPEYVLNEMIDRLSLFCKDCFPFDDVTLLALVKK